MLDIPYISSSENACALACYTMTAKYFFPKTSFEQIARISNWIPKYVVWPYRFWYWIMNKGVKIVDYDIIDHEGWAKYGTRALRKSLTVKEYNWLENNSTDLEKVGKDIAKVWRHKNFTGKRKNPTFKNLEDAVKNKSVCEVVLNSRALDKESGYSLHRVVITGIEKNDIIFHDPREKPRSNRREKIKHFTDSWLGSVDDPELCIYSK